MTPDSTITDDTQSSGGSVYSVHGLDASPRFRDEVREAIRSRDVRGLMCLAPFAEHPFYRAFIQGMAFLFAGDREGDLRLASDTASIPGLEPRQRSLAVGTLLDSLLVAGRAERAVTIGLQATATLSPTPFLWSNYLAALQEEPEARARFHLRQELARMRVLWPNGGLGDPGFRFIIEHGSRHELLRDLIRPVVSLSPMEA